MSRFGHLEYSVGYAVLHGAVKGLLRLLPGFSHGSSMGSFYKPFYRLVYQAVAHALPWVLPHHSKGPLPQNPQNVHALSRSLSSEAPFDFPPKAPLVTVVTRTMPGREHYLKNAMASVVRQTWPHMEHWIIQDGLGDQDPQCLHGVGFNKGDLSSRPEGLPPVQVHFMELASVGRSMAANMGLQMARGQWCLFLDDDDELYPDHLTTLAEALINHPHCVAAYSLAEEVLSLHTPSAGVRDFSRRVPAHLQHAFDWDRLQQDNYFPIQSVLFERRLFLERGGFHPHLEAMEDWNLWLRYAQGNQFHYVPRVTSMFRTPAHPLDRIARERVFTCNRAHVLLQNQKDRAQNERVFCTQVP